MIPGLLGFKQTVTQTFTENGKRIPVTTIQTGPCTIIQIKPDDAKNFTSIQLGFGSRKTKNISRPVQGHIKKAGIGDNLPRFLREVRLNTAGTTADENLGLGKQILIADVFKVGDAVTVSGISKGKGFAGVVKRHHFRGGPRTHGQSDRERAPGSIGQTTTPGRVYRGKRMAGRMGNAKVTVKNLKVIAIDPEKNLLVISGLVPGPRGSLLTITRQDKVTARASN